MRLWFLTRSDIFTFFVKVTSRTLEEGYKHLPLQRTFKEPMEVSWRVRQNESLRCIETP